MMQNLATQNVYAAQILANGTTVPQRGLASRQKPWHSDNDLDFRREIMSHIIRLIQKHNVKIKSSSLARDLENMLYFNSNTKEEYGNLLTLEHRICSLMLYLRNKKAAQLAALPGSHISEFSAQQGGYQSVTVHPGSSNFQFPGSGTILSSNTGSNVLLTSGNTVYGFGAINQVAGLSTNVFPSSGDQTSLHGFSQLDQSYQGQMQLLMRGSGSVSRRMDQFPGINCGSGIVGDNTYGVRNNDLNFQISNMHVGLAANPNSLIQTPANPVLTRISAQSDIKLPPQSYLSQQMPYTYGKTDFGLPQGFCSQDVMQVGSYLNSPTVSAVSQEIHHEKGILLSTQQVPKEIDGNLVGANSQCHLRVASELDMLVDISPNEQNQLQINRDQLLSLQKQQTAFENQGNWSEKGADNRLLAENDAQNMPKQYQQLTSLDQHSEQTCQASSADTGQSEVVSNDDSFIKSQEKEAHKNLQEIKKRQWLLMLLWHVSRCKNTGHCTVAQCGAGREMMKHIMSCQYHPCSNPRCALLKALLVHHNKCRNSKCAVCGPVRVRVARSKISRSQTKRAISRNNCSSNLIEVDSPVVKRAKLEVNSCDLTATVQEEDKGSQLVENIQNQEQAIFHNTSPIVKDEPTVERTVGRVGKTDVELLLSKTESPTESSGSVLSHLQGCLVSKTETGKMEIKSPQLETKEDAVVSKASVEPSKVVSDVVKCVKKKVSGITYLESLTPEQIRQHIASLRKWIGQSKGKAEKNQAMEHQMSSNACSACAVEQLTFDPIPIFCTQCGCRIKRNAVYHCSGTGDNSLNYCGPCYNRFDVLETDGMKVQKSSLEKKKNDEHRVEGWVECDKCKKWQHQICVLFNARINKDRSEYICPECCIAEIERGERVPLSPNSVLGAKDLPRTMLSDFIEERLARKLKAERAERSKALGKRLEEIPTAEDLVVRVISSVDKKLEAKPKFLELFQQEFPKEFQYRSKMLMLFQKIEGVEVCLFGMYVQEFGADCPQPNHRHVYLSYLDSVKYFRPDVKAVTGEALRTYVYHEILIAYLDHCKRRGFSSCYIWACPPLKGDDYILYCHPEIQKTPKTDKLREWYLNMITKAKNEHIVLGSKNLYDYFFTSNGECKAKVTALRLPYFDGDYLPGAAEDILQQLEEEEKGLYTLRKGKTKVATKRTTKTSVQADVGGSMSKDFQLMQKLGQSIAAMKEDFIMVHMHHSCSWCRSFIVSGPRWFCQQCGDSFQLCGCCYEEHQKLTEDDRHPAGKRECHILIPEETQDIPADTIDKDEIMECEFFDNRQAFLSLCQGNQYQYDTLRRAKHSSMMILYHLHNPSAPAFVSSCSICHTELDAGQGWKCRTCADYDICAGCFTSEEAQRHPHKFIARTIAADQMSENADARKQRMLQLRMMLDVLMHASKCRDASCQYDKCRNMKELFRHGFSCPKRVIGGCAICKRMWFLLTAHARSCKETQCSVPRCMDLRKHLRRAQLQQESRRRAAVNEMIRQRAAETAGGQ